MKHFFRSLVCVGLISPALLGVSQAQLGPCAAPLGPLLPDLTVARRDLRTTARISEEFYETNSCDLIEGCLTVAGNRRLLRFTTTTPNVGKADLFIGDPSVCIDLFHFSECHGHYHFEEFASYRLWTRTGYKTWKKTRNYSESADSTNNAAILAAMTNSGDLISGRKQGFCMLDSNPYPRQRPNTPPRKYQNCAGNQGITVGWSDTYAAELPCQYLDITELTPGKYILEIEANPDRILPESSFKNNAVAISVKIPPPSSN